MKKLLIIAICMAGVMMACTNKGKTGQGYLVLAGSAGGCFLAAVN